MDHKEELLKIQKRAKKGNYLLLFAFAFMFPMLFAGLAVIEKFDSSPDQQITKYSLLTWVGLMLAVMFYSQFLTLVTRNSSCPNCMKKMFSPKFSTRDFSPLTIKCQHCGLSIEDFSEA